MKPYLRKIQYYETDKMGIAHHANYVHWMEEARIDFLDQLGWGFDKLEAMGVASPVLAVDCRYKSPCTFADTLAVTVGVARYSSVRICFAYEMKKPGGELVCQAHSEHCFTAPDGRLLRLNKVCPALHALLSAMAAGE